MIKRSDIFVMMGVCFISGIIGVFCWPYAINSFLIYHGKLPVITRWQGFFLGCIPFFGQLGILVAVEIWILVQL